MMHLLNDRQTILEIMKWWEGASMNQFIMVIDRIFIIIYCHFIGFTTACLTIVVHELYSREKEKRRQNKINQTTQTIYFNDNRMSISSDYIT